MTGAIAHGVTFSIQDSEDGSTGWADKAEVSETLAKLTAAGVQKVAFWPKDNGRPYARIKALSDDNASLYSASAEILAVPQGA